MERELPFWMLRKRVHETSSYDSSWEEKAFAQDTAGLLGGSCVWPPRSYTCTFCKREFRSAQALGGHMNVHRRDRARLKHFANIANDQIPLDPPLPPLPPHQNCAYFCNNNIVHGNPNPNICHPSVVSRPKKISRVESQMSNNVPSSTSTSPCFVSSQKRYPCFATHDGEEEIRRKNKEYLGCNSNIIDKRYQGRPSLSISLVIEQNFATVNQEVDLDYNLRKRKRVERSPQHHEHVVIPRTSRASMADFESSPLDELDLELRLGSSHPKFNG